MASINWLGLVKDGVTGGLSSAVSGTLSNVACYGLAWGLDSIFGLQIGKPGTQKKIEELKEALTTALDNINTELVAINGQLATISKQIASLNAAINATYHMSVNVVLGVAVNKAITAIATVWQTFQIDVQAVAAASADPAAAEAAPLPNIAETLATSILASNNTGISYQINTLTSNLLAKLPGGVLGSDGMLDNWTTMLIGQVRQGLPLQQAYSVLEQNFLQMLQYLYQAHSLMLNAYMYRGAQTAQQSPEAAQVPRKRKGCNILQRKPDPT